MTTVIETLKQNEERDQGEQYRNKRSLSQTYLLREPETSAKKRTKS